MLVILSESFLQRLSVDAKVAASKERDKAPIMTTADKLVYLSRISEN